MIDWATYTDNGLTYTRSGRTVAGTIIFSSGSDITVNAFDGSTYLITTLPDPPQYDIDIAVWARNASNNYVSGLFVEIATSGTVRVRNYTPSNITFRQLKANFAFNV